MGTYFIYNDCGTDVFENEFVCYEDLDAIRYAMNEWFSLTHHYQRRRKEFSVKYGEPDDPESWLDIKTIWKDGGYAMKRYEAMKPGENLSWCRCYTNNDRSLYLVVVDGEIYGRSEMLSHTRDNADTLIEKYELHHELGCSECPFRDHCDAMKMED